MSENIPLPVIQCWLHQSLGERKKFLEDPQNTDVVRTKIACVEEFSLLYPYYVFCETQGSCFPPAVEGLATPPQERYSCSISNSPSDPYGGPERPEGSTRLRTESASVQESPTAVATTIKGGGEEREKRRNEGEVSLDVSWEPPYPPLVWAPLRYPSIREMKGLTAFLGKDLEEEDKGSEEENPSTTAQFIIHSSSFTSSWNLSGGVAGRRDLLGQRHFSFWCHAAHQHLCHTVVRRVLIHLVHFVVRCEEVESYVRSQHHPAALFFSSSSTSALPRRPRLSWKGVWNVTLAIVQLLLRSCTGASYRLGLVESFQAALRTLQGPLQVKEEEAKHPSGGGGSHHPTRASERRWGPMGSPPGVVRSGAGAFTLPPSTVGPSLANVEPSFVVAEPMEERETRRHRAEEKREDTSDPDGDGSAAEEVRYRNGASSMGVAPSSSGRIRLPERVSTSTLLTVFLLVAKRSPSVYRNVFDASSFPEGCAFHGAVSRPASTPLRKKALPMSTEEIPLHPLSQEEAPHPVETKQKWASREEIPPVISRILSREEDEGGGGGRKARRLSPTHRTRCQSPVLPRVALTLGGLREGLFSSHGALLLPVPYPVRDRGGGLLRSAVESPSLPQKTSQPHLAATTTPPSSLASAASPLEDPRATTPPAMVPGTLIMPSIPRPVFIRSKDISEAILNA